MQTRLQQWLDQGYQANMAWMANPKRQDIRQVLPQVRSIICVALNYYTPHQRPQTGSYGKIARYGWGRVTGPVQDKSWAQQAGLGWVAIYGFVITRDYGSWVFLGEILTNVELPPARPHADHCGTCTRCLDACPTAAIRAPGVVDASRCIAYHTIENRERQLPPQIADR